MLGAFTAGLRAGYAFASWPLMGDEWFPDGGWNAGPSMIANLVYNPIVVQFVHRWWAWIVAVAVLMVARFAPQGRRTHGAAQRDRRHRRGADPARHRDAAERASRCRSRSRIRRCATLLLGALVWGGHALAAHAIGRRPTTT